VLGIKDRVAIAGVGQTELGKGLADSELVLACRAIRAALHDCGIDPSEVDGLSSFTMEPDREQEVARNLGLGDITWFSQVGYGGGGGCATVLHAAMAIATGQCTVAVAWRSRKRADKSTRMWAQTPVVVDDMWQWSRPWGLLRPADEIAMLMRRYMHDYGATREQLAEVALAFRAHANRNPHAAMYERPLTLEGYLDARWISEPLCLFDNCLESDGAAAVVLVAAARARDLPRRPVYVHAGAQGLPRQHQAMTNYFCDDPLRGPPSAAAPLLWRHADFGPADVKVAQLYDAFSPLVLFSLEGYGFCGRGEAAAFVEGGALGPDGRLPTNTSGGSMSEAYLHGFNLITEGVRQLRGTSTSQVAGADTCLVTSGECVPTSALLLRSDA
jgi:acetyl-CoA acetyltransferase